MEHGAGKAVKGVAESLVIRRFIGICVLAYCQTTLSARKARRCEFLGGEVKALL